MSIFLKDFWMLKKSNKTKNYIIRIRKIKYDFNIYIFFNFYMKNTLIPDLEIKKEIGTCLADF